jgi:hypothetical protein
LESFILDFDCSGYLDQEPVSGVVPVIVIDRLETIQINKCQVNHAAGMGQRPFQLPEKTSGISDILNVFLRGTS